MALWGKTDTLASAPKYVARKTTFNSATAVNLTANTINLTNTATSFSTGDEVFYSINGGTVITGLTNNTLYYVRVVGASLIELYNTYNNAIAPSGTTGRVDFTVVGVGSHTLQLTGEANEFGDSNYNGSKLLFIDRQESQQPENRARGLTEPGWWVYRSYVDSLDSTRHRAEHLIFMDVVAGTATDAGTSGTDDAIAVDGTIRISAQPAAATKFDPASATFAVTAAITAGTGVIAYNWQVSADEGDTWSNASGGVYTNNTTATLAISNTTGLNGYLYRVQISSTGSTTVVSNAAVLTVNQITVSNPTTISGAADPYTGSIPTTATITGPGTLAFAWETSTDSGATWTPLTANAVFSAVDTDTLVITAAAKATYDADQFRVVVSSTGGYTTKTSGAAGLVFA